MTKIKKFGPIHRRAKKRKGDELVDWLVDPASPTKLRRTKDDRILSAMTACVFRAGFRWKVIKAKWPGFEEAFHGFTVPRNAAMDDEIISDLMLDTRVVRNRMKIETVRENAAFILRVNQEHKSFGRFLASWPEDDLVGLFEYLKKNGSRLGGRTGTMFLREVGKDTFILSPDVVKVLIETGAVDREPSGKRDMKRVQEAFNQWHDETGLPYCHLSRIAACSVP